MRSLVSVVVLALALTACSGEGDDPGAPAETVTVTTTPTPTTPTPTRAAAPAEPRFDVSTVERVIFIEAVHMVAPDLETEPDRDIVDLGKTICRGFARGATAKDMSNPDNFTPKMARYIPSIIVLSAANICPEYETLVDKSDLKFADEPSPAKPPKRTTPTSFGDGTYLVGEDVAAGTYRNDGDTYGGKAPCVAYTSTNPNDIASYISGSTTKGPGILIVNDGEYLTVQGCKTWSID